MRHANQSDLQTFQIDGFCWVARIGRLLYEESKFACSLHKNMSQLAGSCVIFVNILHFSKMYFYEYSEFWKDVSNIAVFVC